MLAPSQSPRSPTSPSAAHSSTGASPTKNAPPPPYEDAQERDRRAAYLRDQAWTLYCHGEHSPAIAVELEVPERTIRSWLQQTREELATELPDLRRTHLLLAVDSLRELLATTWELLDAERHADLPLLSDYANCTPQERLSLRPRHTNAPRYLALAFSLQKELDRLLSLTDPGLPVSPPTDENPAETATPPAPSVPAPASFVAAGPPDAVSTVGSPTSSLQIAAKTAISSPQDPSPSREGIRSPVIRPSPTLAARLAPARATAQDHALLADLSRLSAAARPVTLDAKRGKNGNTARPATPSLTHTGHFRSGCHLMTESCTTNQPPVML